MSKMLYLKRVLGEKIFWLSVLTTIGLLMCSIVYTDVETGQKYTFISMFYDEVAREALDCGLISMYDVLLGYDTSYLWMFCPIIAGVPCVLTKKTERFVLFRMSKRKYVLWRYIANLVSGGIIMASSYAIYMMLGMSLVGQNMWDMNLTKKLLSVFAWGICTSLMATVMMEFVKNKYLILCVPFVLNYFMNMFTWDMLPYDLRGCFATSNYQNLFLNEGTRLVYPIIFLSVLIFAGGILKCVVIERRCDCGQ